MLEHANGCLIRAFENGQERAMAHGCNCLNIMGGGIAYQVKKRLPELFEADTFAHNSKSNVPGNISFHAYSNGQLGVNLYTQRIISDSMDVFLYLEFSIALHRAIDLCVERGIYRLAIPEIGGGRARGDKERIHRIILSVLQARFEPFVIRIYHF